VPALSGTCIHPTLGESESVMTSRIVKVEGRLVTTQSGSVYKLTGRASKDYREWCASKGLSAVGSAPLTDLVEYWKSRGASL
jgi:hypothetical protein